MKYSSFIRTLKIQDGLDARKAYAASKRLTKDERVELKNSWTRMRDTFKTVFAMAPKRYRMAPSVERVEAGS